jgi:hypothetical protein
VERCPADVIPAWLAYLTPDLDDSGTEAAWPATVRRYAVVVRRGAETLDDAEWRRVLARTMIAVVAEAAPHDPSESCVRVSTLWSCVLAGDEPSEEEWTAAKATAEAPSRAEGAAGEAAWVAWAAVAARRAATEAARAARAAARAAEAARKARTARGATREATWDRITAALLDGIELECSVRREEVKA